MNNEDMTKEERKKKIKNLEDRITYLKDEISILDEKYKTKKIKVYNYAKLINPLSIELTDKTVELKKLKRK